LDHFIYLSCYRKMGCAEHEEVIRVHKAH
jgi:hypothetical protein